MYPDFPFLIIITLSEKKFAAGGNKSAHQPVMNARKLEEETDELRHNRVDRSLSQAIQQARLAKKMSQKQLATLMAEKPQVVSEYESGKAIPSPAILSKMEKVLGTRLPRPSHKK
eukprot:479522_1